MNVIIIGGGLFGSIAAEALYGWGHEVTIIDDARPGRGSAPAACLMAPSWMTSFNRLDVAKAFDLLDQAYTLHTIQFQVGIGSVNVKWVNPAKVMGKAPYVRRVGRVREVVDDMMFTGVVLDTGEALKADAVLVAAGVWTNALVKMPPIKPLAGIAYTFEGVHDPAISVWAPYKQLVRFSREPGTTWVGDGSAILEKNWSDARQDCILNRCRKAIGDMEAQPLKAEFGLRPYVDGHKGGFFERTSKRVWVSTGGAKNGTIIAAIQAQKFVAELRRI